MTTFINSIRVYNNDYEYLGRIQAYGGNTENYSSTFYPASGAELSQENLRAIYDKIAELYPSIIRTERKP